MFEVLSSFSIGSLALFATNRGNLLGCRYVVFIPFDGDLYLS